ncbi:GTP cyclohydrolase I FolE2 [Candidatus Sumerlaeota bacterium]|nr:GTP cyclohydrolase I FolE2 [Candidatus Sumerlaeota bacterium]
MPEEKRFLIDVGMRGLPFPIRVHSRDCAEGQPTIANISISARIMREFQAKWIETFIQILHRHRDNIGPHSLSTNIRAYMEELKASTVRVDFEYPFFYEKRTPVSKERCLVRHSCTHSAKLSSMESEPKIFGRVEIPLITTYPGSIAETAGGLFGQLTLMDIDVELARPQFHPEDFIDIADRHALAPVYSFLTEEDQASIIQRIHTEAKSSVVVTDEVKEELARDPNIRWYSVRCRNSAMLHTHTTFVGTEKSMWVPLSTYEEEAI